MKKMGGKGVLDMARYRVNITVYKDPTGKTLKGPTFVHFLGDLCSGVGVIGILEVILALTDMEKYGAKVIIVGIVMAVAGFALMAVFHKQAKQSAEAAAHKVMAREEGQTMTSDKSN